MVHTGIFFVFCGNGTKIFSARWSEMMGNVIGVAGKSFWYIVSAGSSSLTGVRKVSAFLAVMRTLSGVELRKPDEYVIWLLSLTSRSSWQSKKSWYCQNWVDNLSSVVQILLT